MPILSIEVQMKKIPLKLYKEFVEENGLEQKLEKWFKKREKSSNAKPKIELGKLVERKDLREGQAYWTGDIDNGGPEAWLYNGMYLTCFGTFINPVYGKKFYEISKEDYQRYVDYWIVKAYGKKFFNDLKSVEEK